MTRTASAAEADQVEAHHSEDPERVVVLAAVGWPSGWRGDWLCRRSSQSLEVIDEAVSSLEECGVLVVSDGVVVPSAALIRLDALNMIGA